MSVRKKEAVPTTKVVVRCLPPTLQRETFLEQVSPLPEYDYMHFAPADTNLGIFAFSTVYVNFLHMDDVVLFREKFDGYVFLDNKGGEYPAVVEFAPYQKVPKKKPKRPDEKNGTIEKDNDYKKYLETFQSETTKVPNVDMSAVLEEIEKREKEVKASRFEKGSTPLIEFLKNRKEERRLAIQKSKDDKRKKEIERKQREEELRAVRKRNELAKLKQQERNVKERGEFSSTNSKSLKSADSEHVSETKYKSAEKYASFEDSEKKYSKRERDSIVESKRSDHSEKRASEKHESDSKSASCDPKVDAEHSGIVSSTSTVENASTAKVTPHDQNYRDNVVHDKKKSSVQRDDGDIVHSKRKDGSKEPSSGTKYDDRYKYGTSQADRRSGYDSQYYNRRPKEWSSSGRSEYYPPSKPSKYNSRAENGRSAEEKKPSKFSANEGSISVDYDGKDSASKTRANREKHAKIDELKQEHASEGKDLARDRHKERTPDSQERTEHRRSAVDESRQEQAHQQKIRYRDRPERAIYNPKQRAAERRKQTQPAASDRGDDGGSNLSVEQDEIADNSSNVQEKDL